jgi:hypothetical protein
MRRPLKRAFCFGSSAPNLFFMRSFTRAVHQVRRPIFLRGANGIEDGEERRVPLASASDYEAWRPGLMIQHWVEDIAEKQHCRLVSLSDMFAQQERSKMQLAWDMGVKPLSASSCEFTNSLSVFGTDEFLAFVLKIDAPSEQLKKEVQRALDAHNAEETPNFARSIERRTLSTAVSSTVELARDALPT